MTERTARNPKYIVVLAAIAGAILLFGALLRPQPDAATSAAPPPSETDLLRLTRLSQRRSLHSMAEYFAFVADEAAKSIKYLPNLKRSGVAWTPHLLVTSMHAQTPSPGPELGLMEVEWPGGLELAAIPAATPPRSGDWIVAVWQSPSGRAFAPGSYLEAVPTMCERLQVREVLSTLALAPNMAGGGVFDVDGRLLAVLLQCGERLAAIDTAGVTAMLEYARSPEGRLLSEFGFRADQLSLEEAAHFKVTEGTIVREVWSGHLANKADLRPGDIVSSADLQRLLSPEWETAEPSTLEVQRGPRTVKISLTREGGDPAPSDAALSELGLVWDLPQRGYPIVSMIPGSVADKAGIRRGDVLLRINQVEPRNLTQVRRLLSGHGSKTAFVELERNGRLIGVLVF